MKDREAGDEAYDDLLADIAARYAKKPSLKSAWDQEEPALTEIVAALPTQLENQYLLGPSLGIGGSGVVVRVRDQQLGVDRALKFSRPSPGRQQLLADLLTAETERLLELSHPNLMRVYAKGTIPTTTGEVPYYVMDLFEGVDDADDYVARLEVTETGILHIVERVLDCITYIHAQGQAHSDLKPGNILVQTNGEPVIADFGFGKVLRDESGVTFIGGTEGYIHPDARRWIVEASSDPNRLRGEAPRREIRHAWDLYALGKTILRLLDVISSRSPDPLSLYTHRYLRLLACRMLDGHNSMDETLLGLSRVVLEELKYEEASDALRDIRKLTGAFDLESSVPELNPYVQQTIQVSTVSTTPFTPRVASILQHPDLLRLGGFTQLSLLNLVYPTATHTRLEHAIGVFSVAVRYLTALYADPINPLFRQLVTEEDVKVALLAALLHDIGHYALAHDLEEAEPVVFSHETRGLELLQDPATGLRELIESDLLPDGGVGWGVPLDRLLDVLRADPNRMTGRVKDRLLHTLIDGPIDADKIDYIIRDSTNLGLTYGSVIDVERLLRCLTIVSRQSGENTYVNLAIHEKGRVTAEAVAFARYALYGSVYWHHAYRAVKAVLKRIVWEYLAIVSAKDKTSHEGMVRRVHRELYAFLRPTSGAPQSLPLTMDAIAGQVHPADKAMLEWLAVHSSDCGRELAAGLELRLLFKRVLVISQWGNRNLWDRVVKLANENNWRRSLKVERELQAELKRAVEELEGFDPDARTTLVFADARNSFLVAAGRSSAVVLLDAPPERAGSRGALEFVEEDDRRRARIENLTTSNPEVSRVWTSLRKNLQESIGKVRIYCHPDHVRFLSALNREVLEQALDRALRAEGA